MPAGAARSQLRSALHREAPVKWPWTELRFIMHSVAWDRAGTKVSSIARRGHWQFFVGGVT